MNKKAKGTNAERSLLHKFWKAGWACIRVAGSGSQKYPSPDLISGKKNRKFGIECKTSSKESIYLKKKEIRELKEFCDLFGLEAWLASKFNKEEWFFISLDDLKETEHCFKVNLELCKLKGILFEELIKF